MSTIAFIKSAAILTQGGPVAFPFFMFFNDFKMSTGAIGWPGPATASRCGRSWDHENSLFAKHSQYCFYTSFYDKGKVIVVIKGKVIVVIKGKVIVVIKGKVTVVTMYVFLTNCILIFFMDLVYDVKDVFCALFYIIKQYFLHISLGHLEGMSCLLFWDQIFFSVTTGFLQFPQSFFSQIYPY